MSDEDLCRVLAPAYVRAIRRYSENPLLGSTIEARQWGIDGDNGAFAGMHEASARIAAASALAARGVMTGACTRAWSPVGGIHHALANRAMGFGLYNDGALAIREMLDNGAERVAYIDVDVHHGNGTQWIFYEDPRVLTISIHESGQHLFPGSGFAAESGGPRAEGTSINVALPLYAGDHGYRASMERVIGPAVRAFQPDGIVTQCGVDSHHADPLSHLTTTLPMFPWLWRQLRELADEVCDGRWLALCGGGYEPCSVPPRAWAALLAEQAGVSVPDQLPESWRQIAIAAGCPEPAHRWLEDLGPEPDAARDANATTETDQALAQTLAVHSRFLLAR